MKKLLLTSISLLFLFVNVQAQSSLSSGKLLGIEITKATNGIIEDTNTEEADSFFYFDIRLPQNTSLDEVRTQVASVIDQYNSIGIGMPWQRNEDEYQLMIEINNEESLFLYLLTYYESTEGIFLNLYWV